MTDPRSLTERLTDAAVDAKETLRDLHVTMKDLRTLLRECEQMKRDLRILLEDITTQFEAKAEEALKSAGPAINAGVEDSIVKYTAALKKSTTALLDEISAKIERQRREFDGEIKMVMDDLERTMDVSKNARDLSTECSKDARAIAALLERLAFSLEHENEGKFIRLSHDEKGIVRLESIHEGDLDEAARNHITHLGPKLKEDDGPTADG